MKKAIIIPVVVLFLIYGISWAYDNIEAQKDFQAEIQSLYNFQPHTLNEAEIKEKSNLLDQFWTKVKSDKIRYLPLLRNELQNDLNPSFFFYDSSKLLLTLSESFEDKFIALKAIPKVDLHDIQYTDYLRTVHFLAKNGMDTSDAALQILDYPDFKAMIPLHALTLDQNFCLIYMLIPTKEKFYLQKLCDRLKIENDETAQKSLMELLWYTVTDEGDQAIEEFSKSMDKSGESRNWANKLLERSEEISFFFRISLSSFASLKEERKKVMHRISDEALVDFNKLTARMRAKRK